MLYIVDLDGTICNCAHRLHYIGADSTWCVVSKKDWEGFYEAAVHDAPIYEVIAVVRALYDAGHTVVVSTGRPLNHSRSALDWLQKYRVYNHGLYMRDTGDHREDYIVKEELLNKIIQRWPKETIGGAFEDREQVVAMYRRRGIKVFQVAEGKF